MTADELDDMADGERSALGLSIGATNLAAVTAERAVTRKPVLTLYRQRPPEVGVPSENPKLNEPGLVITDFVDRVGDPDGIVAADGTTHRSETLVADALRALSYAVTDGRALPDAVAVTHPAHWGPAGGRRGAGRVEPGIRMVGWAIDAATGLRGSADRAAGEPGGAEPRNHRRVRFRRHRNHPHPGRRRRRLPGGRSCRADW